LILLCFFFFQAEDGIRDFHVTGVQTCALPIWNCPATGPPLPGSPRPAARSWPCAGYGASPRYSLQLLWRHAPPARLPAADAAGEIGRASCRERVESWVVAAVVEGERDGSKAKR